MIEHMRAWRCDAPGPLEDILKLVHDASYPAEPLSPGQVLIQVASAALNPADYQFRDGSLLSKLLLKYPNTFGFDLSGRVAAVGEGVTDVKPGDFVTARMDPFKSRDGALSEFLVVSYDQYSPVPPDLDLDVAAAMPTAALTAYQSISPYVAPGDRVFINGGSGGIGTFSIQIAKALGCHVTVSCSTAKRSLCEELGADEIIDYKTSDLVGELRKKGQVFKLAVDNVGTSPANLYEESGTFLQPDASFVKVGGMPSLRDFSRLAKGRLLPLFLTGSRHRFVWFIIKSNHEDLARVVQWVVDGKVKAVIDSKFEFEDVPMAFAHLQKGSNPGKVIVHVQKV